MNKLKNNKSLELNLSNYLPLRDMVYNSVRDAILCGKLKPGKRLMEVELAEMLGVSRTPVREALRKLEVEGFIEMAPRKGAIVKVVTVKDIQNVLEIRASLEALATRIACRKMNLNTKKQLEDAKDKFIGTVLDNNVDQMIEADINFHDIIFSSTQNDRLIQIINNLKEQIYKYRAVYIRDKSYLQNIIIEHNEIYSAIVENNEKKAEQAAINHIQNQENALIKAYKA